MFDSLNKISGLVAVAALVVAVFAFVSGGTSSFGATESTTFTNPITFEQTVSAQAESNKFGSANTSNYLYIGAGDGCAAVYFSASTTQTVQATSTSFCND